MEKVTIENIIHIAIPNNDYELVEKYLTKLGNNIHFITKNKCGIQENNLSVSENYGLVGVSNTNGIQGQVVNVSEQRELVGVSNTNGIQGNKYINDLTYLLSQAIYHDIIIKIIF